VHFDFEKFHCKMKIEKCKVRNLVEKPHTLQFILADFSNG